MTHCRLGDDKAHPPDDRDRNRDQYVDRFHRNRQNSSVIPIPKSISDDRLLCSLFPDHGYRATGMARDARGVGSEQIVGQ